MRVELTTTARLDILDAQDWYQVRAPGLGIEFARAIDTVVSGITRFPEAYPRVHGEVRKAVLRRFPYSLLFIAEPNRVLVLACFHHRRDPQEWPDD